MIEVEAKIKILDPKEWRSKIKKLGKYKGKEKKVDEYYSLKTGKQFPRKSLRVRQRTDSWEVNIKKKIDYIKGVHAKNEVELKSQRRDKETFLEIIKDLGFKKWLIKEKETELYMIKKDFHIEINNVKNLGWYLEVEYLTDKKGIQKARKEVLKIMEKLGVKDKDIIKSGYTKLLWNKKN